MDKKTSALEKSIIGINEIKLDFIGAMMVRQRQQQGQDVCNHYSKQDILL